MSILTLQEAADMLRLDAASNYPQLNIILPAIDEALKTATGKDWGTDTTINPLAKMVAVILLVRWFGDPGQIGKEFKPTDPIIGMIGQLHAIALSGV